jgi:hypothetical protein
MTKANTSIFLCLFSRIYLRDIVGIKVVVFYVVNKGKLNAAKAQKIFGICKQNGDFSPLLRNGSIEQAQVIVH